MGSAVLNSQTGYLVRTKASSDNEGGILAGYSVLSSLKLVSPTTASMEKEGNDKKGGKGDKNSKETSNPDMLHYLWEYEGVKNMAQRSMFLSGLGITGIISLFFYLKRRKN